MRRFFLNPTALAQILLRIVLQKALYHELIALFANKENYFLRILGGVAFE